MTVSNPTIWRWRRMMVLVVGVLLISAGVVGYQQLSESTDQRAISEQASYAAAADAAHPAANGANQHGSDAAASAPSLPAGTRRALLAFVDPQASGRLPADFHYQVDQVSDPDEVAAVVALLRDRSEGDTMRHEAANLLRR